MLRRATHWISGAEDTIVTAHAGEKGQPRTRMANRDARRTHQEEGPSFEAAVG